MSTAGPAVPPNEAAAVVNSKRLLRFTRPFQPSSKKGAAPGVAPRKWREDEPAAAAEVTAAPAAAAADNGKQQQSGGFRSYANSVVVTKDLVDEFISKLNALERDRAVKGLEPIPVNSVEAQVARAERFMNPEERAELERSRRFGAAAAAPNLTAAGANLVASAPKKQQQQRSRSGGDNGNNKNTNNGGGNNNNKNAQKQPQQQQQKSQQQQQQKPQQAKPASAVPVATDDAAVARAARFGPKN